MTAGNDIANGAANRCTGAGPSIKRSMMVRRVGSASAWNTRSRFR